MTLNARLFFLLTGLLMLPSAAHAATQPDVAMWIVGTLTQSSDRKVTPSDGDIVSVVNAGTNQVEATSSYGTGAYSVMISKPASFNGTQVFLRLTHAGATYNLIKAADGSPSNISFNGSFPFPVSLTMNLAIASDSGTGTGTGTGTGSGTGTGTPPPSLAGDLNGDSAVNEVDVGLLKQAISGQATINKTKMDLNGDQVVNTRDLIDLIRSVREASRARFTPASIIPKH